MNGALKMIKPLNILRLKSLHPMTEFAPTWDIPIGTDVWEYSKIDIIENWLINNEDRFKKLYSPSDNDGGTGLGKESLTSRFFQYNIFKFSNELPELNDLFKFIQLRYLDYTRQNYAQIRNCNIVCWYNVVRKGEQIKEHAHGTDPLIYLSGNMHLNNYKTKTHYRCPIDKKSMISLDNLKGDISIFPSWLPHYTDIHSEDPLRVSIGFDIHVNEDERTPSSHELHTPFMNKDFFEKLRPELI